MSGITFSVDKISSYPWQNLATSSKVSGSAGISRRRKASFSGGFSLSRAAILADLADRRS